MCAPYMLALIISGWNLSWGEGIEQRFEFVAIIISGWNLSWGEGHLEEIRGGENHYIRLESELG